MSADTETRATGAIVPGAAVCREVVSERVRQDIKWGEQNHEDGTGLTTDKFCADNAKRICDHLASRGLVTFRDILHEEVCEAFAETDPAKLRAELIQVAAVAVAWVEAIDRRAAE